MKLQQILEAKYVSQKKGWLWAVEEDVETTLHQGYDKDQTMEFFNWAKDNKKTLNHLYQALQDNAQDAYDFLEDNWGRPPTGEQLNFHWYGELDYTELAVYQQLRKILPTEELNYVARIMIDVVADEIRSGKFGHITEDFPKTRTKRVKRLPRQHNIYHDKSEKPTVLRNPKVQHLGSGSFASAYSHEDRPHDVRRVSKPMIRPDAYQAYLKALKKNPDHDNPYFPQIHEVTKYQGNAPGDAQLRSVLSVKTERLHPLHDLNHKEVLSVFERWFGEDYAKVLAKIYPYGPSGKDISAYVIPDIFRMILQTKSFHKKVVDQDLVRAVVFLDKRVINAKVGSDIGINNLMFRRSPFGIQIVITDPVA